MTRYILKGVYEEKSTPQTGSNIVNFKYQGALNSALQDLSELEVIPTELGIDTLLLAEMVYLADTSVNRKEVSEDGWTRELHLIIPVSDISVWNKCTTIIKEMLDFLTGDIWTLEFKKRDWTPIKKPKGLFNSKYSGISLFSGGLDSLVGALDHLESSIKQKNLFVSFAGDGSISKKQGELFDVVSKHYKNIDRLRFKSFQYEKVLFSQMAGRENTTRGRSFLFIAIAVFAGSGLNRKIDILIPENGIMSLNVPLNTIRIGALSTRTTHPFYIRLWNKLLYNLGFDMILKNPYWDKTKGEMLKGCKDKTFLKSVLSVSSSCAHPAMARWTGKKECHCGYCIPCIIRRAAIYSAFTDDPTEYMYNQVSCIKTHKKLEQIQGMKYALYRLKNSPSLSNKLIHIAANLGHDTNELTEYASLYKRGMKEITDFFTYWGV